MGMFVHVCPYKYAYSAFMSILNDYVQRCEDIVCAELRYMI